MLGGKRSSFCTNLLSHVMPSCTWPARSIWCAQHASELAEAFNQEWERTAPIAICTFIKVALIAMYMDWLKLR